MIFIFFLTRKPIILTLIPDKYEHEEYVYQKQSNYGVVVINIIAFHINKLRRKLIYSWLNDLLVLIFISLLITVHFKLLYTIRVIKSLYFNKQINFTIC